MMVRPAFAELRNTSVPVVPVGPLTPTSTPELNEARPAAVREAAAGFLINFPVVLSKTTKSPSVTPPLGPTTSPPPATQDITPPVVAVRI